MSKDIRDVLNDAFALTAKKVCAFITSELKAHQKVTNVKVENTSTNTIMSADVSFEFSGAVVSAALQGGQLKCAQLRSSFWLSSQQFERSLSFSGRHDTVASMLSAVSHEYGSFVRKYADHLVNQPLGNPALNRKQIVLMRQTQLIDAGFDAETKLMANGAFSLLITHELDKKFRKEVVIS